MEPSKAPNSRLQKKLDILGLSAAKSKAQAKQITAALRAMIEHTDKEIDRLDVEWMNLEHIARKNMHEANEPDRKAGPSSSGIKISKPTSKQVKETPAVKIDIDGSLEDLPALNLKVNAIKSANAVSEEEFDSD